jgi:hypothetical protein
MSSRKSWNTAVFSAATRLYSIARIFILSLSSLSFLIRRFLILECLLVFGIKIKQLEMIWGSAHSTFLHKCLDSALPSLYFLTIFAANVAFLSAYWVLAAVLLTGSSFIAFLEIRLQLQADYQLWLKDKTKLNTEKLRFSAQESLYALSFTLLIACAYFVPGCALLAGGAYLCVLGLSALNAASWAYHWRKIHLDTPNHAAIPTQETIPLDSFETSVLNFFQISTKTPAPPTPNMPHKETADPQGLYKSIPIHK